MRLVKADAIKTGIRFVSDNLLVSDSDWLRGYQTGLNAALEVVDTVPTIDADFLKHGRWVPDRHGLNRANCSACNTLYKGNITSYGKYCPNCGTKMDLDE